MNYGCLICHILELCLHEYVPSHTCTLHMESILLSMMLRNKQVIQIFMQQSLICWRFWRFLRSCCSFISFLPEFTGSQCEDQFPNDWNIMAAELLSFHFPTVIPNDALTTKKEEKMWCHCSFVGLSVHAFVYVVISV